MCLGRSMEGAKMTTMKRNIIFAGMHAPRSCTRGCKRKSKQASKTIKKPRNKPEHTLNNTHTDIWN